MPSASGVTTIALPTSSARFSVGIVSMPHRPQLAT